MAIIKTWAGDGLSAGAASVGSVGTGDDAFSHVGTGINITTDGTRSPRLTWPGSSSDANVRWWPLGDLTAYAIRFYISYATLPSASHQLLGCYTDGGGATFRVEVDASNIIRVYDNVAATIRWTSGGALSAGTEYRVEVVGSTAGTAAVSIYVGESTSPLYTNSSVTIPTSVLDEVRFGQTAASAVAARRMDDFAVANTATAIGPVDSSDPPIGTLTQNWVRVVASAGTSPYTIARTAGQTVSEVNVGAGDWIIPRHAAGTSTWVITDDDDLDSDPIVVPAIATGSTDWPKRPNSGLTGWE